MRKLTEQEKEVCDKAYWEWPGCGDGRLHYVPIAFEAGFIAGLDHAAGQGDHQRLEIAKQVEELQAERDEARAALDRLRAYLKGDVPLSEIEDILEQVRGE